MRKYEICVIVNPDVDDRQINGLVEKSLDGFKKDGGAVDNIEFAGRRRLAYDIQKKSEGNYVFLKLTAEPAVVKELNRLFTLNESIMRTKVFRDDSKKAAKAKPKAEAPAAEVKAPESKPAPKASAPKPAAPKAEAK